MRVGIALGSNLGDRHAMMTHAVEQLNRMHCKGDFLQSSFIETNPIDCPPGSPRFLNAVTELDTILQPMRLLESLQQLEIAAGRPSDHQHHAPRSLDLDILYYGSQIFNDPKLQLPHPRIRERLFVLKPLVEIRPNIKLPGWDLTAIEYLLKYHINNTQYAY